MTKISKSVIQKDGKYLLLKRSTESKSFPGLWDFAGGKDDPGETPEQSVIRETKEETTFDIDPGPMVKETEYHDDQFDLLLRYFEPTVISGELTLSHEHTEIKWVSQDEIVDLETHPSVPLFFE